MTVRRWIKIGRLHAVQVGREMRIPRAEIERLIGTGVECGKRLLILYARVSGYGQQSDLERQLRRLQALAADERAGQETLTLADIGSGLKTTRRQLRRLLKLVCDDNVSEVAITYEDRLMRFGQSYLEMLFACFGATLTVLDQGKQRHWQWN
jgi:putative resolvase